MRGNVADTGNPVAMAPLYHNRIDRFNLYTREMDGRTLRFHNQGYPTFGFAYMRAYSRSKPSNIITGSESMEQIYLGVDDFMYHLHWRSDPDVGGFWDDKVRIGDQNFVSPPTAVTITPGRVDLFGVTPEKSVVHKSYQNSTEAWTGWNNLGGNFTSLISAIVVQGTNHIELWGLQPDGTLWHRPGNGTHWPVSWDSHKGNFISAPALVSSCPGVYHVFAIGTDHTVKHARYQENPAGWNPAYQSWNSLGGAMQAFA